MGVTVVDFKRVNYYKVFRFSISSIDAGGTGTDNVLPLPPRGVIHQVVVICPTSTSFNFALSTKLGVTAPSVDVILKDVTINKEYRSRNLGIPYFNNDTTMANKLYLTVVNNDLGNPTGVISVEVTIDERGYDR